MQPAKRVPWRTTFNPDRDFVVIRGSLTTGGVTYSRGDAFDKSAVTARRLRQLFDKRVIHYPDEQPGALLEFARRQNRRGGARAGSPAPVPAPPATGPEIPDDWATMPWNERRALAREVSGKPIRNGPEAAAAIKAELARRGTA